MATNSVLIGGIRYCTAYGSGVGQSDQCDLGSRALEEKGGECAAGAIDGPTASAAADLVPNRAGYRP